MVSHARSRRSELSPFPVYTKPVATKSVKTPAPARRDTGGFAFDVPNRSPWDECAITWCPEAVRDLQVDLWPVPPWPETAGGFVGSVLCQAPSSEIHPTLCQRAVGCQLRGRVDSYTRMGRGSRPSSSTTTQSRSDRSWLHHLLRHAQGRFWLHREGLQHCCEDDPRDANRGRHHYGSHLSSVGPLTATARTGHPPAHREAVLAIR